MVRFHVNGNGEAGVCKAQEDNCPLSDETEHYSSLEEARKAYEEKMVTIHAPKGLKKLSLGIQKAIGLTPEEPVKKYPKFKADPFTTMAAMVAKADELNYGNAALEKAEYSFVTDGVLSGETPAIPDYFKEVYSEPTMAHSDLTLKNWEPKTNTQKFIVHELLTSAISQHLTALSNAGLRRDRFLETLQGLIGNPINTANKPEATEGKISSFDEGWIAGYHAAAREAMDADFPESSSYEEQMKHLRKFIEHRAVLLEADWALKDPEARTDFAAGIVDSHTEWLSEDFHWEVDPKKELYE